MEEHKTQRTPVYKNMEREFAVITIKGKPVLLIERVYTEGILTYENDAKLP